MGVDAFRIQGTRARAGTRTASWLAPAVTLVAAATAFAWTFHADLQRLYGMTSSAWDLAYDQQVIWNVSVGQGFYSSFARANFLGIHFELIFVVLAAVEKVWASPVVLLIFSSAGLAATAPAAYLFLKAILPADRGESQWLALALALPIPFWATIQEAARDFFHPENMALAMALLAAWAGIRGHRKTMWFLCVLVLTCKEDQVYTVGVIGLLMAAYGAPEIKKHWRFIVYLAGAWFLIGTGIVQQQFRNGGYTDFVYYGWLFLHPSLGTVLAAIFNPRALLVVAAVIASMGALSLLAPRWLLLVIPPYLADVLSSHDPQNVLDLHYALLLLFPLIVAGGVGARKLLERTTFKPAYALLVVVPALLLAWGIGRLPPALDANPALYSPADTLAELQTATAMIPANAPVSADDGLAVWLANRHQINDFPDKLDPTCYVVIDHQPYISGPTNPAQRLAVLDQLASTGRHVLYDDGRFQVWSPATG
ncbi:MAG TPA: DUF2079 domain-containing protein [Candidatus Acidoferrum sp.]|jgi:uncharacterized membrane protein|nr:DUF2079 domain-containing protein [Candidatus Acidoferrum sp.]